MVAMMRKESNRRGFRALAALACAAAAAGCARVPLDHQLRTVYELSPDTLMGVQVYTSDDIVLERRVQRKRGEAGSDRSLVLQDAELIRRVHIPKGTPGVIVGVEPDRLHVQFEPGATLTFGSTEKNRERLGGLYNLMAYRWENGRGRVKYGVQWFLTQPGAGAVHLVVRKHDVQKTKVVKKTVRGMKAGDPAVRLISPPPYPDERESLFGRGETDTPETAVSPSKDINPADMPVPEAGEGPVSGQEAASAEETPSPEEPHGGGAPPAAE